MAQAAPIIIGIAGLALSGYQVYESAQAADEAKEIGKKNQERIEAEAEAEARRERFNLEREKSTIRARIAASGIAGATPELYYEDYIKQREDEITWLRTSAKSRGEIAKEEGQRAARIGYAGAAGNLATSSYQSYDWFSTYV